MGAPKGNKFAVGNKGGAPRVHTDEYMQKIAEELEKWSHKPDALFIKEFTSAHKDYLTNDTFVEWCEKNNVFAGTFQKVRDRLISRLRKSGLFKETDPGFTSKILPLIDPEYREWCQLIAKIDAESKKTSVTNIISWKDAKKQKSE